MVKVEATPLVQAAAEFDEALAAYGKLGQRFLEAPLDSVKHLERANHLLAEIAGCEERLQASGQQLVKALAEARERQEQLSTQVVAHVPAVQERNRRLQELMGELTSVAGEVADVNTRIQARAEADATQPTTASEAFDISQAVLALSGRAEQLAATSREAQFEELSAQAHSLHQRLQVIGKKLAKAGGN